MRYIYDLTVNFNNKYIDFFEWNESDKIVHFHKLPIIRIDNDILCSFILNKFKISNEVLYQIKKDQYTCVLVGDDNALVVKFSENGYSFLKSSLIASEELDILENTYDLELTEIKYEILSREDENYMTRKEEEIMNYLKKEVENLDVIKDHEKIKYLYLECFDFLEENSNKALLKIKKYITNKLKIAEIYHFFKLIQHN